MTGITKLFRRRIIAAVAFLVVCGHAHATASDADFVAAKAAYERADWRQLDALVPALAGHPLERYVRYWQLKSRLEDAQADLVDDFFAHYPDCPLAYRLRVEWL